MKSQELPWRYTTRQFSLAGKSKLAINVTGLTTSFFWMKGLGGTGETSITRAVEQVLGQKEHDDAGHNTRMAIANRLGLREPVSDQVMVEQLLILRDSGDYSIDYLVDNTALNFLLELLHTRSVAVVGTKILQDLVDLETDKLVNLAAFNKSVALLSIGVRTSNYVATARKLEAARLRDPQTRKTSFSVFKTRWERYLADKEKYEKAYPGFNYASCGEWRMHAIFDNSRVRTQEELVEVVRLMLGDFSQRFEGVGELLK